jgi:hypothetical protein
MLVASYVVTSFAICGAAIFLCVRLRLFLTATTMLLASLLLIYGPAYLSFMLSSGEKSMVIARLSGSMGGKSVIFSLIEAACGFQRCCHCDEFFGGAYVRGSSRGGRDC